MIKFLPNIYPNESCYSYLSRIYAFSGYSSHVETAKRLLKRHTEYMDYNFINSFSEEFRNQIEKVISFEDLLFEHTLYKYYVRFLPNDLRNKVYSHALSNQPGLSKLLPIPLYKDDYYLRYCPMCVDEDRMKYGECYFHVDHLIPDIHVCSIHKRKLLNTTIKNTKMKDSTFVPLELVVDSMEIEPANEISIKVAKYILNVFHGKLESSDTLIGDYLTYRLNDKYFSNRGQRKKLKLLKNDLDKYYCELSEYNMSESMLGHIFVNKEINVYGILLVSMFENIKEEELVKISKIKNRYDEFDDNVWVLYNKGYSMESIAEMLNVNKTTISNVIRGKYK